MGKDFLEAVKMATCAATINAASTSPRGSPKLSYLLDIYDRCVENMSIKSIRIT